MHSKNPCSSGQFPFLAFQNMINRDSEIVSAFAATCRSEAEIPGTNAAGLASEREIDIIFTVLCSTAAFGGTFLTA